MSVALVTVLVILIFLGLLIWLVVEFAKWVNIHGHTSKHPDIAPEPITEYHYDKKIYIMTDHEKRFYKRLFTIFGKFYFIFPQIQLSTLLDHQMYGQNWRGALSSIQRKSIDYVFCTTDFKIIAAIELDDATHDRPERQKRDKFVEEICREANLSLIRFRRDDELSDEEIREKIIAAIQGTRQD